MKGVARGKAVRESTSSSVATIGKEASHSEVACAMARAAQVKVVHECTLCGRSTRGSGIPKRYAQNYLMFNILGIKCRLQDCLTVFLIEGLMQTRKARLNWRNQMSVRSLYKLVNLYVNTK